MKKILVKRIENQVARNILFLATLVTIIFVTAFIIGYCSIHGKTINTVAEKLIKNTSIIDSTFIIIKSNVPALLFSYSGVITLGFSSLIAIIMLGIYTGSNTYASVFSVGALQTINSLIFYAPFEIIAYVMACVASLIPIFNSLFIKSQNSFIKSYIMGVQKSTKLFLLALILLLFAALFEALVLCLQ